MKSGFKGVRNTNGRPKGALNVSTAEIRAKFNLLIENNIDRLQTDIDSLEPKDRIQLLIQISKFVLPTLKTMELVDNDDKDTFRPIYINLGAGINPELEEN
jgi:hypothetical protein